MRAFTIRDYTIPDDGWSEYFRKYGPERARRYLADPRNLLPAVRVEYFAWKRNHPEAAIFPDRAQPFSPLSRHKIENPKGYPRIR